MEKKKSKAELLEELEKEELAERLRRKEDKALAIRLKKEQKEKAKLEKKKDIEDLKKLKVIFRKYKGVVKARYDTAPFREPILMLERITGKVEFYESKRDEPLAGEYTFVHTDGRHRTIELTGVMKQFQYYDEYFRGWYCHEDFPFPLPQKPLITSQMYTLSKDKDLNDVKNYRAQEITAKGKMIYQVAIGIAVIIGAIIVLLMIFPDIFSGGGTTVVKQTVEASKPVINRTIENLTVI